jgi:peptide/nickel transport system substrate-binding protein
MSWFPVQMLRRGILVGSLVVVAACSAAPQTGGSTQPAPATDESRPRTPKTLRVAVGREPSGFVISMSPSASSTGGATQAQNIPANKLQNYDDQGRAYPELALSLPTETDGSWRVNDDGTMETTWRLRSGIQWHDGAPVTAEDIAFGYRVVTTPNMATIAGDYVRNISEVVVVDPTTVLVKWARIFANAAEPLDSLPVLPKHLLEQPLATLDPEGFINLPYWTSDFVGNGPFRVVRWEPGLQIEFAAFDGYYLGRPKIDRLFLRFIPEPNTQVASILAGEIDVTLPVSIDVETALAVQERWREAGTGGQVLLASPGQLRNAMIQQREEMASLKALLDPRVRQALYRAVDRHGISEVVSRGQAPVADSPIPPFYAMRKEIESAIPQYPYNPDEAVRALGELGWTRGGDGTLRNAAGEPFRFQMRGTPSARADGEQNSTIAGWKLIGIQVDQLVRRTENDEERIQYPGMEIGGGSYEEFFDARVSCRTIPNAANRFRGRNSSGYCSQPAQSAIDRLQITIPEPERIVLIRELIQVQMTDVAMLPLYWDLDPILAVPGVKGLPNPTAPKRVHTWNVATWDRDQI